MEIPPIISNFKNITENALKILRALVCPILTGSDSGTRKTALARWFGGLSACLWNKGLLVQFPVGAHAWLQARSLVGGVCKRQLIDISLAHLSEGRETHQCFCPSLSPSFPLSLKINKWNLKKKKKDKVLFFLYYCNSAKNAVRAWQRP